MHWFHERGDARRALVEPAASFDPELVRPSGIRRRRSILVGFLEPILPTLKSAGLRIGRRGAGSAGALLAAEGVTRGQLVRFLESLSTLVVCRSRMRDHEGRDRQRTEPVSSRIRRARLALSAYLTGILAHDRHCGFAGSGKPAS